MSGATSGSRANASRALSSSDLSSCRGTINLERGSWSLHARTLSSASLFTVHMRGTTTDLGNRTAHGLDEGIPDRGETHFVSHRNHPEGHLRGGSILKNRTARLIVVYR